MAFDVGSVIAHIKADTSNFEKGINSAKSATGSLKTGIGEMSAAAFKLSAALTGVAAVGTVAFLKSASKEASEFEKAMITLEIIAGRFGESAADAKKQAQTLGKELRIGVTPAAEGLQNLLKSGLSLDQASDLLRRFTNEAMTGKSPTIDLGTAVNNLAFAYATGNSALGNMSGISENWSDIAAKGTTILEGWNGQANASIGITEEVAKQLTDYEKVLKKQGKTLDATNPEQAKYVGLLALTNLTMGSSAKFTGTLIDTQAEFAQKITDIKLAIGQGLNPVLNEFLKFITALLPTQEQTVRFFTVLGNVIGHIATLLSGGTVDASEFEEALTFFTGDDWEKAEQIRLIIEGFASALRSVGEWIIANQEMVLTFLKGLAIAFGALAVIGGIIALVNALTNPIVLVVAAVALLYTAWSENWGGIQEKTGAVIGYLTELFGKHKEDFIYIFGAIKDFAIFVFNQLKAFWETWGGTIKAYFKAVWEIIGAYFKFAFDTIIGITKFFIAIFKGDWSSAWEAVKAINRAGSEFVIAIFNSLKGFVGTAMRAVYAEFTAQFTALWNKAKELADKIRNAIRSAFDKDKKNSPSIMDTVGDMVKSANSTLLGVSVPKYNHEISQSLASSGLGNVAGAGMGGITINLAGAYISDEVGARRMAEIVGDDIIKKLRQNVRF